MASQRPVICGIPKPLTPSDPPEWWQEAADREGISVESLREQVQLADALLDEIIAEERAAAGKGP
jgi:hypothetical protein